MFDQSLIQLEHVGELRVGEIGFSEVVPEIGIGVRVWVVGLARRGPFGLDIAFWDWCRAFVMERVGLLGRPFWSQKTLFLEVEVVGEIEDVWETEG